MNEKIKLLEQEVGQLKDEITSINNKITETQRSFSSELQPHFHKSDRINTKDLIGGFPVLSATPTYVAEEGKFAVYDNGVTRRLYIKANQTWRYVNLT